MREAIRKIGFVFLIVVLSAIVYVLFYAEQETRQNVLAYSLDFLGERLFAVVEDGPEAEKLRMAYNEFKHKALQGEVSPRQIEQVAAGILNVSNREEQLSPQQAENILRSSMLSFASAPAPPGTEPAPEPAADPTEWRQMTERVKSMCEFDDKMQEMLQEKLAGKGEIARKIHYKVGERLQVIIDPAVVHELQALNLDQLHSEIKQLEQANLVEWQENLAKHLQAETAALQHELADMAAELQREHAMHGLTELDSLKRFEVFKNLPISPDSIRKLMEKSLQDAGIRPGNREQE